MKKIFVMAFLCLTTMMTTTFSQVPQAFRYQAVVRGSDQQPLLNQTIGLRLSILSDSETGTVVYSETHTPKTNASGLISVGVGNGTATKGTFSAVNWSTGVYFMEVEIDVNNSGSWVTSGVNQLLPVPYAMYAEKTNTSAKFEITGNPSLPSDSALFEVKDRSGNTVFAVYEGAVRVYVSEGTAKGGKGGFAVGGRSSSKGIDTVMWVTPDSIRFYFNSLSKGGKGGFAVGGRSSDKGSTQDIFHINFDSLRISSPDMKINIPESSLNTGAGFSVGYKSTLGVSNDFFRINPKTSAQIINPSKPNIIWYPQKEAFLVGRVLIQSPDSVGTNSIATGYESKAIGNWSQAFGYQSVAKKDYATAIGRQSKASGSSSFAFGNSAWASGDDAYALGSGSVASGNKSFAFGSIGIDTSGVASTTPTKASGEYAYAIGLSSQATGIGSMAIGSMDTASGSYSIALGRYAVASESQSLALNGKSTGRYALSIGGTASGYRSNAFGYQTKATGSYSTAIGCGYSRMLLIYPPKIYYYPTVASGSFAVSIGTSTDARGNYATAMGYRTTAKAYNSFVVGRYNTITGDSTQWALNDPLFVVGNGNSYSDPSDALVVYKSGETKLTSDTSYYTLYVDNKDNDSYTYGIYSRANGSGGTIHYGVYGYANGANTNYGIYGSVPVGKGYAGYFSGNTYIADSLGIGIKPAHKIHIVGGAYCDGGSWINGSDRNLKENFTPVSGKEILSKVDQLPISEWNYKTDNSSIKHIGPVAQDFYSLFGVGNDNVSISTIDPAGISLAAIQELSRQNKELKEQIDQLKKEVEALKESMSK